MSVQRYRSAEDRTRRIAGVGLVLFSSVPLALLMWAAIDERSTAAAVIALLPAGLIALGVRLVTHVKAALDVDLLRRRYTLIRDGKTAGDGALDDLGPLRVTMETQTIKASRPEDSDRHVVRYKIKPAGYGFLSLYSLKTPGGARRKLETLARKWNLPCRALDGAVRAPHDVDVPLHVRLRDDDAARAPVPLRPEWRVGIGPIPGGHAIVSHNRAFRPLAESLVMVGVPVVILAYNGGDVAAFVRNGMEQANGQAVLALMAAMACGVLWHGVTSVREALQPGAIEITDRGVRYRGSRMAFDRIEEITSAGSIEIVGDRDVLTIAEWFCPREAVEPVAHELQRLIIETAPARR